MKQVAVGIIRKNGFVLACQRKRDARYPLKWEFPGGKIEPNESPQAALERELREELSIRAVIGKKFFQQDWTYLDDAVHPKKDGSFRVHYYMVESFHGEPLNKAFEQIRWTTPAELQTMDVLEGNREAVELLIRNAKDQQTT